MQKYKIADVVFNAEINCDICKEICKNYEYFGNDESQTTIVITKADIDAERVPDENWEDGYLESLALSRKLCDYLLSEKQAIIFHSSAVMVDNKAYLFTAPSGTGKSTHVRLWQKLLGDKAVIINDDKPIIRYVGGEFFVYGTPWNGKHRLDTNTKAKVHAICSIYQAKENKIEKADLSEMLITILNQTVRPTELDKMDKLLGIIDRLLSKVNLYKLGCNISLDSARLSFNTMSKGE